MITFSRKLGKLLFGLFGRQKSGNINRFDIALITIFLQFLLLSSCNNLITSSTTIEDSYDTIITYTDYNEVKSFEVYKNENKHGTCIYFNLNNTPSRIVNYKNGMLHGIIINFYNNGKIRSISNYYNDLRYGFQVRYTSDGDTSRLSYYDKGDFKWSKKYTKDSIIMYDLDSSLQRLKR